MKKFIALMLPLFISAVLVARPDEPEVPAKSEVMWHTITVIDYKPGTVDNAKECIRKFEAASEKAGIPSPEIYWFESGKYDVIVTWKLQDGPADLQGKWNPAGETWWKALVTQEGSEEAALKLQNSYNELIATSHTSIARKAK
jgi:hypothetical protein